MEQQQINLAVGHLELNLKLKINKFIVNKNVTLVAEDDAKMITLVLEGQRLSGPFWMSLFIPSICLILAAEIALFIDHSHFEAMIMVALTSNLVMYTLYSSVQSELPEDSSLKLIDIWLLHGLVMPMVVFVVLAANEMISPKPLKTKSNGTRVSNSAIVVAPKNQDEESCDGKMKTCMLVCKALIPITSVIFISTFFAVCHIR